MGIRDLFFSIIAQDKTSTAFGSVNKKLKETSGAASSASERIDRVGKSMARVGAAGSVSSAGITATFRGSIGLYDEQARAEAKVAQAIKATGGAAGLTADELKKQASALQGVTRFGDERILNEVTAQLLTFKNIATETFSGAQMAALDLATILDGDLQSASIMLGKALNEPAKQASALGRVGALSREAAESVKALAESGDLLGAQTLILKEIESAYGGQAKAARDAGAGILDAWSNTWGDIKEIVGENLLGVLRVVIPALERLTKAFEGLSPQMQQVIVLTGALAVALPPLLAAIGLLVVGMAGLSPPVAAAVVGIAALTAAVVAFWQPISDAARAISETFTAALTWASEAMDYMIGKSRDLDAAIAGGFAAAMDFAAEKALFVYTVFRDSFNAIPGIVGAVVAQVGEWINGKFNAILDSLGKKVEWVEGKFAWLYDKVVGNSWVPDMIEEIGAHFGLLQGNMVNPTDRAAGSVSETFESLGAQVGGIIGDMVKDGEVSWRGLWDGMLSIGKSYSDRIVSDVFNQLGTGLQTALSGAASGSASPSGGGLLSGVLGKVGGFASKILGFDTGGEFSVQGRAGIDRNLATIRLSQNERVKVERRGSTSDARPVNVYIQTANPQAFQASRAQIGAQLARAVASGGRAA